MLYLIFFFMQCIILCSIAFLYLNFCLPTNCHTIETLKYHRTAVDLLPGKKLPFKTISFALLQVPSNRKHFTSKSTSNYPLKARRVRNYATKLSK